ncbi:MAG: FAD:protein FMN transferase [Opitutus sp.]|nr:FAD:protein FMN transferase [Opitutus sp.]
MRWSALPSMRWCGVGGVSGPRRGIGEPDALHLVLLLLACTPASAAAESLTLTGRAMGTTWSVKFLQPAAPFDRAAFAQKISGRLEQLEQQFSTYRPAAELARFNAAPSTDWIPVSPELARVAVESRRISELTGGAFDATVAPLVHLWGFGPQRHPGTLPSDPAIGAARDRVDYRRLEVRLSPPTLRKHRPDLAADFSSMAKGFAADAVGELLVSLGAPNHFVQLGGDVRTGGRTTDGAAWRAGIEEPDERGGTIACVVALADQALSTSGDARNFFLSTGRRYGHIIDPRTGRPAGGALASVSVVHASCATSSALATALFVLGADAGFAFAERQHLAGLFIVRDGDKFTAHATTEFQHRLSSAHFTDFK